MSRIPCMRRTSNVQVSRPTYLNPAQRPTNIPFPRPSRIPRMQAAPPQQRRVQPAVCPQPSQQRMQPLVFPRPAQQRLQPPVFPQPAQQRLQPPVFPQPAQQRMQPAVCPQPAQQRMQPTLLGHTRQYEPSEFGLSPSEQFQDASMLQNINYNTDQAMFEQLRAPVRPPYQPAPPVRCPPRIYSPSEFGLSPSEQFQDASIFRNLNYETDRAMFEQFEGPVRAPYPPPPPRDLPAECLEDMSFPEEGQFPNSSPSPSPHQSPNTSRQSPQWPSGLLGDVSCPSNLDSMSSGAISVLSIPDDTDINQEINRSMRTDCMYVSSIAPETQGEGGGGGECIDNAPAPQVPQAAQALPPEVYNSVKRRFEDLKRRMAEAPQELPNVPDDVDGDIIRESIIEKSVIENGEMQKSTQHIITRLDENGCEVNECKQSSERCADPRTPEAKDAPISPLHMTPVCGDPFMLRLACNVRRRLDFELPGEITNEPGPAPSTDPCADENITQLGDESAPLYASSYASSPRRSLSMPSEQLGDMSDPSFGSSMASSVCEGDLADISAPFLDQGSPISPLQLFAPMRDLPSQNLSQMSTPSFASSGRSPQSPQRPSSPECPPSPQRSPPNPFSPGQRSPAVCPPDAGSFMQFSPGQRSPAARVPSRPPSPMRSPRRSQSVPREQICEGGAGPPSLSRSQSLRRMTPAPSQQICEQPPPNRPFIFSTPAWQQEHLSDVSTPSFGGQVSMRRSPRVYSLPSDQICDVEEPSYGSSMASNVTQQNLTDFSVPSLVDGSPISPIHRFPHMQGMTSRNLSQMSEPSFASSGRSQQSPQRPSSPVCPPSPQRTPPVQTSSSPVCPPSPQRTPPMQISPGQRSPAICPPGSPNLMQFDESDFMQFSPSPAPQGSLRGPSPFVSPRRSQSIPRQQVCEDRSVPTGNLLSRSQSMRSPQRMTPARSPQICDGQQPPNRPYVFSTPALQQQEHLSDVSTPSFGGQVSMTRSPRVQSLPSDQICDVEEPSYGSSIASSVAQQQLSDFSVPSLVDGSPISPIRRFPQVQNMTGQNLSQMSGISFASSGPSNPFSPGLDSPGVCPPDSSNFMQFSPMRDLMNFDTADLIQFSPTPGSRPPSPFLSPGGSQSISREPICDGPSVPTGNLISLSRSQSMRSPQRMSPVRSPQRMTPAPSPQRMTPARSPQICDEQQPPNRPYVFSTPAWQQEHLSDVSTPSFGGQVSMTRSPRVHSLPSDQICDVEEPSYGSSMASSVAQQQLSDFSVPSLVEGSPISPLRRFPHMQGMTSQNLSQMSEPSFASSGRSQQSPQRPSSPVCPPSTLRTPPIYISPGQRSAAICPPDSPNFMQFGASDFMQFSPSPAPQGASRGPSPFISPRRSQSIPRQQVCVDRSVPTGNLLSRSQSMRSAQRMTPARSPQICDEQPRRMRPFVFSTPAWQQEHLSDVSTPSFGGQVSMRRSPRVLSFPSDQLGDVDEPSFGSSMPSSIEQQHLSDFSAPSLADGSPISPLRRFPGMQSQSSQYLSQMSAPSLASSGRTPPSPSIISSHNMTDRSLPSGFSSVYGPGMGQDTYQQYADVSLPSTFNSPIRPPNNQPQPTTNTNIQPFLSGSPPRASPDNKSFRETLEVKSSVHSISTRTYEDLSQVSQPSFASSGNDSGGFESMPNFMPFDELLANRQSGNYSHGSNPFDDSYCP